MQRTSDLICWLAVVAVAAGIFYLLPMSGVPPAKKMKMQIGSTRMVVRGYATLAERVQGDCGKQLLAAKFPDVFISPQGCTNWRGPYYKTSGKPEFKDAFGIQILFLVTNNQLHIVSVGPDKIFASDDDIIEVVNLTVEQHSSTNAVAKP